MESPETRMSDPLYRLAREQRFRAFVTQLSPTTYCDLVQYGKDDVEQGLKGVSIEDEVDGRVVTAIFDDEKVGFRMEGTYYEMPYDEGAALLQPEIDVT